MYGFNKKTDNQKYNVFQNWNHKNDENSNLEYCCNYNYTSNGWNVCFDPCNPENLTYKKEESDSNDYFMWDWDKYNFRIIPNGEYDLKIRLSNAEKEIIDLKSIIKKITDEIDYITGSGFIKNNI
jgi:hypothetical protein